MLLLKDLPKYECLLKGAAQFPDLDPSACEAHLHLLRVSGDVFEYFDNLLNSKGISQGRFTVLMLLLRRADTPINPADIAERAGVTRATMTGLIDVLERDGFVRREASPDDRRMMYVRITDVGMKFLNDVLPEYYRRISQIMSGLSPDERKLLVGLLGKIQQAIPLPSESIKAGKPAIS